MPGVYPLTFVPMLYEKVWGGRALADLGKELPSPTARYGESWELADMASTSPSGAGGGSARSVIASGAMAGRTLSEVIRVWGGDLMGDVQLTPSGDFPLLVKFLDARENLSVQTHPSPDFARRHPDAHLKTECWYILDCDPGAVIYKGIKFGVTKEHFEAHIEDGSVAEDLIAIAAVPGTCHTLPSGTCHALGGGVVVAEVQTASDTTFRIFDWGRKNRQLHVTEALKNVEFGPAPRGTRLLPDQSAARLSTTEFFHIDEVRLRVDETYTVGYGRGCVVLIVLDGAGALIAGDACYEPTGLVRGQVVLVPARGSEVTEVIAAGDLRLLRVGLL
ncbi:MAG: type I phosphomannose isomerase catalytic subunit [Phycisphaerales bacterium]